MGNNSVPYRSAAIGTRNVIPSPVTSSMSWIAGGMVVEGATEVGGDSDVAGAGPTTEVDGETSVLGDSTSEAVLLEPAQAAASKHKMRDTAPIRIAIPPETYRFVVYRQRVENPSRVHQFFGGWSTATVLHPP
ncbi:MAG: hypothetical protein V3V01_09590 [Acidimicrobiales bacterium]